MPRAACLLACLLLPACYEPPPDPVMGVWDRFIADGEWLPAGGPLDRYTFYERGGVRLERGGVRLDGRTPEVDGSYVTIDLPGLGSVVWFMWREQCVDRFETCLLMSRIDGDRAKTGPADWYHPGM